MHNLVYLIGRLTSDPKMNKTETGKNYSYLTVAVNRAFKNTDGIYETDFFNCKLWNGVAESVCEYCKKGDLIGIKGRLQTFNDKNNDLKLEIIADKISFLSSKKTISDDLEEKKDMEI